MLSPLSWQNHLICIAIGVGCLLWGFILKFIPSVLCKCKFNETITPEEANSKQLRTTSFMSVLRRDSLKTDMKKWKLSRQSLI